MLHPLQVALAEPVVETTLPDEVLVAMKVQADRLSDLVQRRLRYTGTDPYRLQSQQWMRENGLADVDFHAQQQAFYTRYIDAGGIAIVGPANVKEKYFVYAREAVLVMTLKFPELRDRLLSEHEKFYMVMVADWNYIEDIPEYQLHPSLQNDDPWDDFFAATCRISNGPGLPHVIGYCQTVVANPFQPARNFVHEFAHALEFEMEFLKPGFQDRLREAYAVEAVPRGVAWPWYEYWAFMVQAWFHSIGPNGIYPTYEAFFQERPLSAAMLDEWFPRMSLAQCRDENGEISPECLTWQCPLDDLCYYDLERVDGQDEVEPPIGGQNEE